jgi:hypothetical protein
LVRRDKAIAACEFRAKMMGMPLKIPSLLDEARLTGQLLIAMPMMEDPRFAQSVIYLCAHTEDGAMGLVLNRPLISPTFEDLLRQLDVSPTPPARRIALCDGGPSDGARGFVLHTADWIGDGSLQVDESVAPTPGSPPRPRWTSCSTMTTRPSGGARSPRYGSTRRFCPG